MTAINTGFVTNTTVDWDIPNSVDHKTVLSCMEPHGFCVYDVGRYDGWTLEQIIAELRGSTLNFLKRGTLQSLIARREWGGLLVAAAKLVTTAAEQTQLFRRVLDLDLADSRRHMKLWLFWPRVAKMFRRPRGLLRQTQRPVHRAGVSSAASNSPASRAGWDRRSRLIRHRHVIREPLPSDVAALMERVEELEHRTVWNGRNRSD